MTTTSLLPVLQPGKRAYFDSFSGPVPCRIDTITSEDRADSRPSSRQQVTATVTAERGAYHKGLVLSGWGLQFFPRKALGRRTGKLVIKPYRVQA
ncbi:hypothetical protein KTD31_01285 [Burkholderia multivorans]|uniref:hypothetical protein n=1 Tax=Burkholderia multivorans TaxID=87883 RepID=UPI001C24CD72|nr:hypothetical protein [Burkholderia multivorans]MBU9200035.1 hypothetical protein [Burkholderia multivorans]MDN8078846.1 hypothetical protein [Burkholderia multivorans]